MPRCSCGWAAAGRFVERNQQRHPRDGATARLQAGVSFAILGREEKCSGDPARRIGNEFLFETLAKDNVEKLNQLRRQKSHYRLSSLFQYFQERVSAVWRYVRGLSP